MAAAAAAAAAVAVSAPLRVTLEGAHRRTVAQTTGAPVALKPVNISISLSRFVSTSSRTSLKLWRQTKESSKSR